MQTFNAINAKYELGITYGEFYPIASKWAQDKAKASGGFFSKLFSGGIKGLFSIVVAVVSAVATWGASLALNVLSVVAAAASVANTIYGIQTQAKLLNLSIKLKNLASSLQSQKALNETQRGSEQLSQFLISNPYEIFANGKIYKQNNAGDLNDWSSQNFKDCNAGILGQVKTNAADEQLQNRAQINKGGNVSFFESQLNAPFSLAKGGISYEQIHDGIKNHFIIDQKRVNEGFNELNKQDFNYIGTAERIYNRVYDEQLVPFFVRMQNENFLEKIKNYQKGLCAEFDYLLKQKLDPREKKENKKTSAEDLSAFRNSCSKIQEKEQDLQILARNYFESVQYFTAALLEYATSFYAYVRIPFTLPTPPIPKRGKLFCINSREYWQNGEEYLMQKEERFNRVCKTQSLEEYKQALKDFESCKPIKNPNFTPRYAFPSSTTSNTTSIATAQTPQKAFLIKNLEYHFKLTTTTYNFSIGTTISFCLPQKHSIKPLKLKEKPKEAIRQYERFVLDCFLEEVLLLEQNKRHSCFYAVNFNKEPFLFLSPIPNDVFEVLKNPLPKNKKLEGFVWDLL